MSEALETIEKDGLLGEIFHDDTCDETPRDWDNLGVMECFHRRYNLGDETDHKSSDFNGWEEFRQHLIKKHNAVVILPLYLYDHSGLRIKVGSFAGLLPQGHAEFDTMVVGFIYATREAILKEYGPHKKDAKGCLLELVPAKRLNKEMLKKAEEQLNAEVKVYDQYLCGDVYGVAVSRKVKCGECGKVEKETIDSCFGFYGADAARQGLKEMLDDAVEKEKKKEEKPAETEKAAVK